jgi:hypothetical protein
MPFAACPAIALLAGCLGDGDRLHCRGGRMRLSARTGQGSCPAKATTAGGLIWTELDPAASPPARDNASMAYDPATKTVLLFDGGQCDSCGGQTWSWNGTDWTRLSPPSRPGGH